MSQDSFQSDQSANMTDLDDDWAVVLQNMNNTSASISLAPTSQASTAQTVTQTAASEELKGSLESLRDLLGRLPTLERCLDVVRTQPANDTDVGYIGIPDTHTCLNSTIGDAECVNNHHYCSWNYTMRDMGEEYFPRFVVEYECGGCDPQDVSCLDANNDCSVAPLMLSPKILKRGTSGDWRVMNFPTGLVAYCDCRKSTDGA